MTQVFGGYVQRPVDVIWWKSRSSHQVLQFCIPSDGFFVEEQLLEPR